MKAKDLIAQLQQMDPDAEVYFTSCCYPETKWFELNGAGGEVRLEGYQGSYVAGDPEVDPWGAS